MSKIFVGYCIVIIVSFITGLVVNYFEKRHTKNQKKIDIFDEEII